MLIALLLVAVVGLSFVLYNVRADISALRRRVEELEGRETPVAVSAPQAPPLVEPRQAAKVISANPFTRPIIRANPTAPAADIADEPRPDRTSPALSFENLVGGKLPIWVGGIALVFSGFFLVRYTIEAGLFGPAARSITAALFAFVMIAISEFGGRLPKIGASFTADPRVGQSLAGASIATLYGTLYMAAEIYGLVGIATAFILVLLTTTIAFALALRHGPPTALMGLIGGFAAPWVAGMGASNLPVLLLYLAVFIAALFGLAVWRRWLWLLVLASGGGLMWSFALLASANANLGLLGAFIAVIGGGAILASRRFNENEGYWPDIARFAPLAVAFAQLALLVPKMEFAAIGWLFYFMLSGLAIALAWRESKLVPLVGGALLIALLPLHAGWSQDASSLANVGVTLAIIALFGVSGHIRARLADTPVNWAIIGVAAPVLCWFTAATAQGLPNDTLWAALALLAGLPAAWTAWEWHHKQRPAQLQPWATAMAAIMLWAASVILFDEDWIASGAAVVALAVAAWANVTKGRWERRLSLPPLAIALFIGIAYSWQILDAIGASLMGEAVVFDRLPDIGNAARATLAPAVLIIAIAYRRFFATGDKTRTLSLLFGAAGIAGFAWLLAKHVAGIATPSDFIRFGFAERAALTQIFFALGWAALHRPRAGGEASALRTAGWIAAGIAMFRVIWFDLFVHNPIADPQAVGPVPVANLLTMHFALVAFWLWQFARLALGRVVPLLRGLSLGAMIVTVLGTIRQAVQGSLVSAAEVGTGENYLYSAGLLALAIGWLVFGIRQQSKLFRVAGLLLLTVVTLKVFLVDAAALAGLLRILSFLGLGIALIGIGWAYGRVMQLPQSREDVG